jgi:hypothetical protein
VADSIACCDECACHMVTTAYQHTEHELSSIIAIWRVQRVHIIDTSSTTTQTYTCDSIANTTSVAVIVRANAVSTCVQASIVLKSCKAYGSTYLL